MTVRLRGDGELNYWVGSQMTRPIVDRGYTQASNPTPRGNFTNIYGGSSKYRNNDMGSTQSAFYDIVEVGDIWMHFRQVLLPILFSHTTKEKFWVGQQNKLMGGIRIRTVRVKRQACRQLRNVVCRETRGIGFKNCKSSKSGVKQHIFWKTKGGEDVAGYAKANVTEIQQDCYPGYGGITDDREERSPYTIKVPSKYATASNPQGTHALKYRGHVELQEPPEYAGRLNYYPGGGYVVDIPRDEELAYKIIQDLDNTRFIDRATRAMFVDWVTYNPSANVHTIARLQYELGENGFVVPNRHVKTWRLYYHGAGPDDLLWIIFCFFTFYYTLDELQEMWDQECMEVYNEVYEKGLKEHNEYYEKRDYLAKKMFEPRTPIEWFEGRPLPVEYKGYLKGRETAWSIENCLPEGSVKGTWRRAYTSVYYHYLGPEAFDNAYNWIDLINIVMYYSFIFWIYNLEEYKAANLDLFREGGEYQSYSLVNHYQYISIYIQICNGLLIWVKVFKYVTFSKRLLMLVGMAISVTGPIAYFLVTALILTMSFATAAYMIFSVDVYEFRSIPSSLQAGLKYWVTEMDVDKLIISAGSTGWVFYVFWTLMFLMILANVFVAIVIDAYTEENEYLKWEEANRQSGKSFAELMYDGIWQWGEKGGISQAVALGRHTSMIVTRKMSNPAPPLDDPDVEEEKTVEMVIQSTPDEQPEGTPEVTVTGGGAYNGKIWITDPDGSDASRSASAPPEDEAADAKTIPAEATGIGPQSF